MTETYTLSCQMCGLPYKCDGAFPEIPLCYECFLERQTAIEIFEEIKKETKTIYGIPYLSQESLQKIKAKYGVPQEEK